VWLAYLPHWPETEDPGLKLAVFSTGPAIRNYGLNLITEIIGTFMLLFASCLSRERPRSARSVWLCSWS